MNNSLKEKPKGHQSAAPMLLRSNHVTREWFFTCKSPLFQISDKPCEIWRFHHFSKADLLTRSFCADSSSSPMDPSDPSTQWEHGSDVCSAVFRFWFVGFCSQPAKSKNPLISKCCTQKSETCENHCWSSTSDQIQVARTSICNTHIYIYILCV